MKFSILITSYNKGQYLEECIKSCLNQTNKNFEIIGDFDLFYRLSKRFKFNCINLPLATCHIHGNNLSIKKINIEIEEIKKWYSYNKSYLSNFNNNIIHI